MSHQNASIKSIIFALSANLGIAITKTVAAVLIGSGAMLAESIHSYADCGNQGKPSKMLFLPCSGYFSSPIKKVKMFRLNNKAQRFYGIL